MDFPPASPPSEANVSKYKMARPRVYCSVYGCLNSSVNKPEFSFFKLPADEKRRTIWLDLIGREDLTDKRAKSYTVCEEHFQPRDIMPTLYRKNLKRGVLPSRNLPDSGPKKQDPTEIMTLVEVSTQTESSSNFSNDATYPKRKFEYDEDSDSKPKKAIKLSDIESVSKKQKKIILHTLCDKFLTKELAEIVKAQVNLKSSSLESSDHKEFKIFCLNFYYANPNVYHLVQKPLGLPIPNTIQKHSVPITTEIDEEVISIIRTKVESMTEVDKQCSVIIDTMPLKPNLVYSIKDDIIIGLTEIDGVQSPEAASNALVLMVRGIFSAWQQPVGYALLSEESDFEDIFRWIDKLLEKLYQIGLQVKAFISDSRQFFCEAAENKRITVEKPYFLVDKRKIYYIFDASHLLTLVRNDFLLYEFHFDDRVATSEHVIKFYNQDSKKSCRLVPKLTSSHISRSKIEKGDVRYAEQLLSNSVAAGLSTYIDFNAIDESGRDTVEFIKLISDLFDLLNTSSVSGDSEHKKAFQGNELQIKFFNRMLNFFQSLKIIDPKDGKDVTSTVNFTHAFQITIRSVLLLFEDFKIEGFTDLLTKRLSLDAMETFFSQIKAKSAPMPTSRQFVSTFRRLFVANIITPIADDKFPDLGKHFLLNRSTLGQDEESLNNEHTDFNQTDVNEEYNHEIQIPSSDYDNIEFPENDCLLYISSYLLTKCVENHADCETLKSYVTPSEKLVYSEDNPYIKYRNYNLETGESLSVVPSDVFIDYVEKMEEMFRFCLQTKHNHSKITSYIYKEMGNIHFASPCSCFPLVYLKKLFLRMRLFYTIKFSNREFRTSGATSITIPDL